MTVIALSRCVHRKDQKRHQPGASSLLYRDVLRVTLQEAIEFNRLDAIASAGTEYEEESIAVSE